MEPRKSLLCCALALAFSLSACGGGENGVGASLVNRGSTTFITSGMIGDGVKQSAPTAMSNANEVAEALASDTDMQDALKSSSGYALVDDSTYRLKIESDGSLTVKTTSNELLATFVPDDMKFYQKGGVDFVVMADTTKSITISDIQNIISDAISFAGTANETNYSWLGKLDYASFGYWVKVWDLKGSYKNSEGTFQLDDTSAVIGGKFYEGTKEAGYDNGANGSLGFTGVAAGLAEYTYDTGNVTIPITGTATLNITDGSNGYLVLDFQKFYKFTGDVNTGSNGALTGIFTNVEKAANYSSALPYDLRASEMSSAPGKNEIAGQLYGANSTTPSEAAGSWRVQFDHSSSKDTTVSGVFGVK